MDLSDEKDEEQNFKGSVLNLKTYIRSICPNILSLSADATECLDNQLSSNETSESIIKFVSTIEIEALYVEYLDVPDNNGVINISLRMGSSPSCIASIAFIKSRPAVINSKKPINLQVQIMTLSSDTTESARDPRSILPVLLQYTKHSFVPISRAAISGQTSNLEDVDNDSENLSNIQKKIRDMELAFEQFCRGTSIPLLRLTVPSTIEEKSNSASVPILKSHLEKYNASQVDQYFKEVLSLDVDNSEVLERVSSEVNTAVKNWPNEIKRQSSLIKSSFSGTVEREINFWKELDKKMENTKSQLDSPGVLITKLVLKRTNRVAEQLIREAEAELDKAIEIVQISVTFLRDFPIEDLIGTTSLHPNFTRALTSCLQHFSKLRHSNYDLPRALHLLEVLGSITESKIINILRDRNILQCSIVEFKKSIDEANQIFMCWDSLYAVQRQVFVDVGKRRHEKVKTIQIDFDKLKARLKLISEFREQHEKLMNVLGTVLSDQESDIITDLNEAFKLFLRSNSDPLDMSPDSVSIWNISIQMYEKKLEKSEEKITRLLSDRLDSAKSAEEMFRVFATFNPLFFRPAIRHAVNSFRNTLVKNVKEDVKRLQEKFKFKYEDSQERATAQLRGIPPLSGRIVWARQIENQLTTLMKRMEDVLGVGWEDHFEGRQLKEICEELKGYLDAEKLFKVWREEQLKADYRSYNRLKEFILLVEEDPISTKKFIRVNFESNHVELFKEVKFLEWLLPGMTSSTNSIPASIRSIAKEAYTRYPVAVTLQSAVACFSNAKKFITNENSILLISYIESVRDIVNESMGGTKRNQRWVKWDSPEISDWVSRFTSRVNELQDRVYDLKDKIIKVDSLCKVIEQSNYDRKKFEEAISSIQIIIDEMQRKNYSNMNLWVTKLDKKIESILCMRIKSLIEIWISSFTGIGNSSKFFELHQTVHEITLSNQILSLNPPIEQARVEWLHNFHQHISIITSLPRIVSNRIVVFTSSTSGPKDYSAAINLVDKSLLRRVYDTIEDHLFNANTYLQQWLQYQALWEISINSISDKLSRNLKLWHQLLTEIKSARTTIETTEEEKLFGPIVINFRQVQNKISLKYDTWQKEIQTLFANILADEMKSAYSELNNSKLKLESIHLEGPTKDVISSVEFILKTKNSFVNFKNLVSDLELSEKLLQKQRYKFPTEWVSSTMVTAVLSDLDQILQRRANAMDSQLPVLQQKIREEDVSLDKRSSNILNDWETKKPVDGNISPSEAIQLITSFQEMAMKLSESLERIKIAKRALGIDSSTDNRVSLLLEEISGYLESWQAVLPTHEKYSTLRATSFKGVVPIKIRKQIDELNEELRMIPAKNRSYACFTVLLDKLNRAISMHAIIRDLCSEALRERHWKSLIKVLEVSSSVMSLSLGSIWDCNLNAHKKTISEVLAVAQGELALEQFLKVIREHWQSSELNLIIRDGSRAITGWETIFSMLEDHLSSLASLKQSPYFRNVQEIQEETNTWEGRLTHLRTIFDVWVEVQRKWLYLRGIFKSSDIKLQLPSQYTRFKGVDNEFSNLMKKVSAKPNVLDLLQIENLHRLLERQDTTMATIQKALGEYLEKQRQIFPRFYFVNNDDLVEIIGNSNEQTKIFPYFSKMFAGLNSVETINKSETSMLATALISREGETVPLVTPVDLSQGVKEWLNGLQIEMINTLVDTLEKAVSSIPTNPEDLKDWIHKYPSQVSVLSIQISWAYSIENSFTGPGGVSQALENTLSLLENKLKILSETVLLDLDSFLRKKCEQLITEVVHQRDATRILIGNGVCKQTDFSWLYYLRFYWNLKEANSRKRLSIQISNVSFLYGFEYLGLNERLVQTPLTDRCYLTLTQALHFGMGGNPFGPAGTGKTESVKMLGAELGRYVLVFNCDENFDYAAMGRIFSGLCQVGAWGCFDEFNRLEERILSAVSQQILTIQKGLMSKVDTIDLMGQSCRLHRDVGIFVTMNPGYAGRSNLPDNLKLLFRAVAMTSPDRKMIAQVMLFSQGIVTAELLSGKITLLFMLCEEQLSSQAHYDFGLRALKSVLIGAGELKRNALTSLKDQAYETQEVEKTVLIRSTCNSIVPKLVSEDIPLFTSLLQGVFPNTELPVIQEAQLIEAIKAVCIEDFYEYESSWVDKILQLKQVLDLRHGVMMVGPSGSGKSSAWRTLLKALQKVDNVKGDFYIIDPKSIKKDKLYGSLDPNTLEWTDGVFTKILRKIIDLSTARSTPRRSWIIFDGDVDPEWAENLNSVLDDNKILTLPSGDRLKIPPSIRIMMEVDSLQHATLATVSRCGMVWFADTTVSLDMILKQQLNYLRREYLAIKNNASIDTISSAAIEATVNSGCFIDFITPYFSSSPSIIGKILEFSLTQTHIMEPTIGRLLGAVYSLLVRGIQLIAEYNEANSDMEMSEMQLENFSSKWVIFSILWGIGGSLNWENRQVLSNMLVKSFNIEIPPGTNLIDLQVNINDGNWTEWLASVTKTEIEPHQVTSNDIIVTTTDTIRHTEVIRAWLQSHQPLILCGPPGSGKTMTLTSVIDSSSDYILASLNFSSGTTPDLIIKTFAQYCETVDSPEGPVMQPNRNTYSDSKWLVIFCDEVNLPQQDKYGTQRVIMFLRQLIEQGGFWNSECKWIRLKRIQFICACNPPTDAGRVVLKSRFLRHAPLLFVDYPAESSLKQIYRCFNSALLKLHSNLKGAVDPLTGAMVEVYSKNQSKFTADIAPQYIYSPRELSRWVRALYEALEAMEAVTLDELVRLWGHEALRLFHDRIITIEDKKWCEALVDEVAEKYFPGINVSVCLKRPMYFSSWLKKRYESVDRESLKSFLSARLSVFYEEELDVPLVVFDDVLEHVLRIDNVLRHPMGHMLLVGESGCGKTVLSKFVAWVNGLSVYQIKANRNYTLEQFDEDLKTVMRRVAIDGEKICFIFDESNVLSSAFLERMNALLASGEVPGLFEGDELTQLLHALRDSFSQRDGMTVEMDSDLLWRRFTKSIQNNLHVIFTMNPASSDFQNRCTTSPALFNRCVVDWFGTWSLDALAQVAYEFTKFIDTGFTEFNQPSHVEDEFLKNILKTLGSQEITLSEVIVAALVNIHETAKNATVQSVKKHLNTHRHFLSPRDYLDLINKFVALEQEKRSSLQDQQTHIRKGLSKLLETQDQVTELKKEMIGKESILKSKDDEANKKLSCMVENQNAAENAKALAENLTIELQKQEEEIRIRKASVEQELSDVEPALTSAKQSVQSIKKAQMDEVRGLARPPNAVRMTMEMVCVMIGQKDLEWSEIRKVIRGDEFIGRILNFDPIVITQKLSKRIQEEYLVNPEMDFASVDRASKACGPLFQWAQSQISYSNILRKVKPLRDEVEKLQEQSENLMVKQREAVAQVEVLETQITQFKSEYATAIRETEIIRTEMQSVSNKVNRAESLLNSLEQEKSRWVQTSTSFDNQMSTLVGDCLISAAFLTYGGIFDHKFRSKLISDWKDALERLHIPFRDQLDLIEYLSKPSDLLLWKSYGLSTDQLAVQNAIVMDRFNRFPLIVDPSGQASEFVLKKYASTKITTTSFLDPNFMKTIASAIRFGTPLLVNDAEAIDPILNPILNKELQKMGGRTLIRLGNEDVDFSPKFVMILVTRNPFVQLAPDICSRITLVNFTITPASLESQALTALLKAERSDIDTLRSTALKLQGEQSVRIRELEESLLDKISAVQGAILDDDSMIITLENIQKETFELNKEVFNTQKIMEEVHTISSYFEPLASSMASVYFSMEKLNDVNFLYKFNLHFFLDIISNVLNDTVSSKTNSDKDDQKAIRARVKELSISFFKEVFRRVLRSLKFHDKILFSARLSQIYMSGILNHAELNSQEMDALIKDTYVMTSIDPTKFESLKVIFSGLGVEESAFSRLINLTSIPVFSQLFEDICKNDKLWREFILSSTPELVVPDTWIVASDQINQKARAQLLKTILIKYLRPDRITQAIGIYITEVFGSSFNWRTYLSLDFDEIILKDSKNNVPIMLCSEAGQGQDVSGQIEKLSLSNNKVLLQVAMGSSEGYGEAEKSIAQAVKSGQWVLLRNTHLCIDWLEKIEKKISSMTPHAKFRIFLTCEINEQLPPSLLSVSDVVYIEASSGIKTSMIKFFNSIPTSRFEAPPVERSRLYLLLAWLNAIVFERLRYVPLGWTKRYEFNEADSLCALDIIDQWVDSVSFGKPHIDPNELPWEALRTLLSQALYGGRIHNTYDQAILNSFVDSVFSPRSYEASAPIAFEYKHSDVVEKNVLLAFPDGFTKSSFSDWIESLPEVLSPQYLGLPSTAETKLQSLIGSQLLKDLNVLVDSYEFNESNVFGCSESKTVLAIGQDPVIQNINDWSKILPTSDRLSNIKNFIDNSSKSNHQISSIQRSLLREIKECVRVLSMVLSDLELLKSTFDGSIKINNSIRDIIASLRKSKIPQKWDIENSDLFDFSIHSFISNFSRKCIRINDYFGIDDANDKNSLNQLKLIPLKDIRFDLGEMFFPEAFVTATRQYTAQEKNWSLEDMELFLEIGKDNKTSNDADITLKGLVLENALWDNGNIALSDELRNKLPNSILNWKLIDKSNSDNFTKLPLYLNADRKVLITELKINSSLHISASILAQRGVAIILK